MKFRSSVDSTRPLTGTSPITKWKRIQALAGCAILMLVLLVVPTWGSAGNSTITVVSGNNQTGPTNSVLPDPLTVRYLNSAGAPIGGGSLIYTVTAGDAVFESNGGTQTFVSADAAGIGRATVRLGATSGPVTVEVNDFGTLGPAIFSLNAGAPNNSITVISGDNQSANVGQPFAAPIVVELRNAQGALPDGVPVTFQVTQGGATFSNGQLSIVSTTAGGRAQASLVAGSQFSNVSVLIRAAGYSDAFAIAFVNNPAGNPFVFVQSGNFQQTPPNTPFTMPLVAGVDDGIVRAGGKSEGTAARSPQPNVPVTFTVQTGNALFSNGQSSIVVLSNASGDASVFVDATTPEGDVGIAITTQSFGSTTARLQITGASGSVQPQSGDSQNIAPGDTTPLPLLAQVQDSSTLPVAGVNVNFRIIPGITPTTGITLSTASAVSDASGNVSFVVNTTPDTPSGEFFIEASSPGYTPGIFAVVVRDKTGSFSFDIIGGNNQTGPVGSNLPVPFQVQAQRTDKGFRPIPGLVVTFTVAGGAASIDAGGGNFVSSLQIVTNSNGVAGINVRPDNQGGPFSVRAAANISGRDVFEQFGGNGLGTPNTLTIVGGNSQSGPPNTTAPQPIVAEFRNGVGNPVAGLRLQVEITSGNAQVQNGSNPPATSFAAFTDTGGQVRANIVFGALEGAVTGRVIEVSSPQGINGVQGLGLVTPFSATILGLPNIPPTITYDPPAGSGFTLSPDGGTAFGNITASPSAGSGSGPAATTTVNNCNFATNPASFTVTGQPLSFIGSATQPQTLSLTCQIGPGAVTARLTCSEAQGTSTPTPRVFDVTCPAAPGQPTLSIVGGEAQTGPPNSTLPQALVAEFRGSFGAAVPNTPLRFSIDSGNAQLQPVGGGTAAPQIVVTTDGQGRASVEIVLGSIQGQVRGQVCLNANSPVRGLVLLCTPFTATIAPPVVGSIQILSGNNQSGSPGTNSQPLRVQLVSPQGGVGLSAAVTYTVLSGSGSLLDPNGNPSTQVVATTNSDGTASVVFRFGGAPGPVQIRAAANGFGSVVFDLAVFGAGAGDSFRIVGGNNQTGAPATRSQPLVVELLRGGAPGSGETLNWFVRSGDAQVENFATTTGADGRSSNFITFDQRLGQIVLEARTGDGLLSVQFTLNTAPASAIAIRLISGGGQSGNINSPFAAPLVFEVSNASGQAQSGVLVSFAITQGSATLDANSATTDTAGRVSVTGRYGSSPGAIQLRALIGSAPNQSAAVADLTSFAPGLRIVSGNNQSAAVSTVLPAPLVVEVTRPAGSTGSLAGIVLRWVVIEGGGAVASATTTTDATGRANNSLTLGAQAGANRVRVDADGGGTVTFVATAASLPPSAVRLEIVSGNNQEIATNTDSAPLVVRVVDSSTSAPRSNVCVAFAAVTPGVTLSLSQVGSDANGLARVVARLNDVGPAVVSARVCDSVVNQVNFALNGAIQNTLGLDPNDRAFGIAQAFDRACPALRSLRASGATLSAGQADLLARCDELEFNSGNNPTGVVDALEEILSDEAEAQNTAALTIAAAQFDNLKARIAALRSGTNGASFGGLALQGSNGAAPLSFASNALGGIANATEQQPSPAEAGSAFDRWGFFATGTIGDGDRDPGGGSSGFDFETRGLTAGADYRYNDSLILGAALGYASNDVQIGGDAGELETKGWSISGYTTFYKGDSWYADGVLTYGSNQYDITRNVEFTLATPSGTATRVDQINTASPDGTQFSAAFTAGRDFQRGAWGFGPFLRWQYTNVDFDGYTETVSSPGAPGSGLTVAVDSREVKSMQGVLGGKATYTMSTTWGILIPHFQFEYLREFKDNPDDFVSRLVFDPTGTQIAVASSDVDQSFMNLGLGVSAVFANGRSAFMFYEKLLGQQGTNRDSIAIGIRIEF